MADGFRVPEHLAEHVAGFRSADGAEWLDALPATIGRLVDRWGLIIGEPFAYPSLSYVAAATDADRRPCVLKVGFLLDELASEIEALRAYDGRGAARLLAADAEIGALLLERLEPGQALLDLEDDDATAGIAADVMSALSSAPVPGAPCFPIERWTVGVERIRAHFGGGAGPFNVHDVDRACALRKELLAGAPEAVLLHGDLQHYNILSSHRGGWLAIARRA